VVFRGRVSPSRKKRACLLCVYVAVVTVRWIVRGFIRAHPQDSRADFAAIVFAGSV
jgi:hypothetical protein